MRSAADSRTTVFLYDEAGHLLGEYTPDGRALVEYVWLDDAPVALVQDGELAYIETDHLNTPRAVIDPRRNTAIWRWDLHTDAFGSHPANQDPDGDGTNYTLNLRYPGQYFDTDTNLHYNYFRDYEPLTGRYLQSDPIGLAGGVNTYAYVNSNSLIFIDPTGEQAIGCGGNNGKIICDGHGGFEILNCNKTCTRPCTQIHEDSHKRDLETKHPTACRDRLRGRDPGLPANIARQFQLASECKAHKAGKACAEKMMAENCCPDAKKYRDDQDFFLRSYGCDDIY